jgi:hypothetical protein
MLIALPAHRAGPACYEPLLSALADGEASADQLAVLRPHMRSCLNCRARLREFRSTPERVAALVTSFKATPSLFAVARTGTPLAARLPRGTRFRHTLIEDARVTITIQRALPGRRAGGRCVRPTPRLRRARRCIRHRTIGTLTRSASKGTNSIRFTGRIGRRTLRPGRCRALITGIDTAGNRSTPRTAGFRVARS